MNFSKEPDVFKNKEMSLEALNEASRAKILTDRLNLLNDSISEYYAIKENYLLELDKLYADFVALRDKYSDMLESDLHHDIQDKEMQIGNILDSIVSIGMETFPDNDLIYVLYHYVILNGYIPIKLSRLRKSLHRDISYDDIVQIWDSKIESLPLDHYTCFYMEKWVHDRNNFLR